MATTPGKFLENKSTPGKFGYKTADYLGTSWLDFFSDPQAVINLDYYSSSIGLDFGTAAPGIKKIVLTPDSAYSTHRIEANTLNLYISEDNLLYTPVPKEDWEFTKDDKGVITLTLKERIATRYLKLHVLFDDRDQDFAPVDKATFLNELAGMLKVYQEADARTEEYGYDEEGNRSYVKLQLVRSFQYQQEYYPNSNRLKSDGRYQYAYDANGNLVSKEKVERDTYEPDERWEYTYDLLNRLLTVKKNGILVAEYGYDPDGFLVVKKARGETTHYIFKGMEPIYEKRNGTDGSIESRSYVYALGKHLARVDGTIGDPEAAIYFYQIDHLGSVRSVTNQAGEVVWSADYLAFGTRYGVTGSDFEEWHGFTGKEYNPDTGLYYFNARWYDSELGRFISEDPARDPNNPNLYVYCWNNPLIRMDSTGRFWDELGNLFRGEGWRKSTDEEKDERRKSREQREEQQRKTDIQKRYGDKEAERIFEAEDNIPGFKFDLAYDRRFTLENQIQLYFTMSALEEKYKADGNLSGIDNVKLEFARNQLTSAFKYLNTISPAVNLFKDKAEKWGLYYTAEQIDAALNEVGFIQFAAVSGALWLAQGMQVVVVDRPTKTVPAGLVREGQTAVIGKMRDLNAPGALRNGEFKVADYLPDIGSPKANWQQNSGVLRSIMNEGKPIRDVSPYPMGNAGFLGAERNLLQSKGWSYSNGYWYAPK